MIGQYRYVVGPNCATFASDVLQSAGVTVPSWAVTPKTPYIGIEYRSWESAPPRGSGPLERGSPRRWPSRSSQRRPHPIVEPRRRTGAFVPWPCPVSRRHRSCSRSTSAQQEDSRGADHLRIAGPSSACAADYVVNLDTGASIVSTTPDVTFSALAADTKFQVTVTARNSDGSSPPSSPLVVFTRPAKPAVPTLASPTDPSRGPHFLIVTWTAPPSGLASDLQLNDATVLANQTPPATISSLPPNTPCRVRVRFRDDAKGGPSEWSDPLDTLTRPPTPPGLTQLPFGLPGENWLAWGATVPFPGSSGAVTQLCRDSGTLLIFLQASISGGTYIDFQVPGIGAVYFLLINVAGNYRFRVRRYPSTRLRRSSPSRRRTRTGRRPRAEPSGEPLQHALGGERGAPPGTVTPGVNSPGGNTPGDDGNPSPAGQLPGAVSPGTGTIYSGGGTDASDQWMSITNQGSATLARRGPRRHGGPGRPPIWGAGRAFRRVRCREASASHSPLAGHPRAAEQPDRFRLSAPLPPPPEKAPAPQPERRPPPGVPGGGVPEATQTPAAPTPDQPPPEANPGPSPTTSESTVSDPETPTPLPEVPQPTGGPPSPGGAGSAPYGPPGPSRRWVRPDREPPGGGPGGGFGPQQPIDLERPQFQQAYDQYLNRLATPQTTPTSVDAGADRNFWSRGGGVLATGAVGVGIGALIVLSGPVGWVAALTGGLLLASGGAGVMVGGTELGLSYLGLTTPQQEQELNRAASDTLLLTSSPGSLLGGGRSASPSQEM